MLPFVRMLEYGNTVDAGFIGNYSLIPYTGSYGLQEQNRAASTTDGIRYIYTIGGSTTGGTSSLSGRLLQYDTLLNEYKLLYNYGTQPIQPSIAYVNGKVYVLTYASVSARPVLSTVDVETSTYTLIGNSSYTYRTSPMCTDGENLYMIDYYNIRLQRYNIQSGVWSYVSTTTVGAIPTDNYCYFKGHAYLLSNTSFKRTNVSTGVTEDLSLPTYSGFIRSNVSLFVCGSELYGYSAGIVMKYDSQINSWSFFSSGVSVLGNIGSNGIACSLPDVNTVYIFYAATGANGISTVIGKIK